MKIFVSILLACTLLVVMGGCSLVSPKADPAASALAPSESGASQESSPEEESQAVEDPASEPSPEESSPEEPEEESSFDDPTEPETTSGELPQVQGSEDFVAAFSGNEVDEAYLRDIVEATTTGAMIEVTSAASAAWETQLNHAYTLLIDALEGEERENAELEQSAWSNELSIAIEEIQAGAADTGSLGRVDVAYKTMLLFRTRSAKLYEELYEITGEVPFYVASGEAVG